MVPRDHTKQIIREQIRLIEIHKWIESEKAGRDVSDTATLQWIDEFGYPFRIWAESLPYECLHCGLCPDHETREECCQPFNQERLSRIQSKT
jgi:hypothetical protein